MGGLVVEAGAVDGVDAEDFDFAGFDEIGKRADHALIFEFPFVAGAGREADERLAVMAVDDDAHIPADPGGIPAVIFAFHGAPWVAGAKVCHEAVFRGLWSVFRGRGGTPPGVFAQECDSKGVMRAVSARM